MGNRNNVIDLFGHRAARARNQTHLHRIRYILGAVVRNGRVYLSAFAPNAELTAEWFQSLHVDITLEGSGTVYRGRINEFRHREGDEHLLVSTILEPIPADGNAERINVTLTTACGTSVFHDTVVKAQQAR